jgi:hypothetical protein
MRIRKVSRIASSVVERLFVVVSQPSDQLLEEGVARPELTRNRTLPGFG